MIGFFTVRQYRNFVIAAYQKLTQEWCEDGMERNNVVASKLVFEDANAGVPHAVRALFDLAVALEGTAFDPDRAIFAFSKYMERGGHDVTRTRFEQNIEAKLRDAQFSADIGPLLATGFPWDGEKATAIVRSRLTARLPRAPDGLR